MKPTKKFELFQEVVAGLDCLIHNFVSKSNENLLSFEEFEACWLENNPADWLTSGARAALDSEYPQLLYESVFELFSSPPLLCSNDEEQANSECALLWKVCCVYCLLKCHDDCNQGSLHVKYPIKIDPSMQQRLFELLQELQKFGFRSIPGNASGDDEDVEARMSTLIGWQIAANIRACESRLLGLWNGSFLLSLSHNNDFRNAGSKIKLSSFQQQRMTTVSLALMRKLRAQSVNNNDNNIEIDGHDSGKQCIKLAQALATMQELAQGKQRDCQRCSSCLANNEKIMTMKKRRKNNSAITIQTPLTDEVLMKSSGRSLLDLDLDRDLDHHDDNNDINDDGDDDVAADLAQRLERQHHDRLLKSQRDQLRQLEREQALHQRVQAKLARLRLRQQQRGLAQSKKKMKGHGSSISTRTGTGTGTGRDAQAPSTTAAAPASSKPGDADVVVASSHQILFPTDVNATTILLPELMESAEPEESLLGELAALLARGSAAAGGGSSLAPSKANGGATTTQEISILDTHLQSTASAHSRRRQVREEGGGHNQLTSTKGRGQGSKVTGSKRQTNSGVASVSSDVGIGASSEGAVKSARRKSGAAAVTAASQPRGRKKANTSAPPAALATDMTARASKMGDNSNSSSIRGSSNQSSSRQGGSSKTGGNGIAMLEWLEKAADTIVNNSMKHKATVHSSVGAVAVPGQQRPPKRPQQSQQQQPQQRELKRPRVVSEKRNVDRQSANNDIVAVDFEADEAVLAAMLAIEALAR